VVCVHIFLFSFSEEKMCLKKQHLVQDLIPPLGISIHVCTLYTHTNIYMLRFSSSRFFGPSRCLIPTPGLTSKYPTCAVCVCVCVYTQTHPHTLPPALKTEKTQTTQSITFSTSNARTSLYPLPETPIPLNTPLPLPNIPQNSSRTAGKRGFTVPQWSDEQSS